MADNGMQIRFGVRALQDHRNGGQMDAIENPWKSDILNRSLNGYLKVGVPLNEDNSQNIALVADYNYQHMNSFFGATKYLAGQHSAYANLLYQNVINDSHKFTLGLNGTFDSYDENFQRVYPNPLVEAQTWSKISNLANVGLFGEYTYHYGDAFSAIVGVRGDWFNGNGFKFSPRVTLKYMPVDEIVIRANGGRGLRYSTPLVDNIGVFSTSKEFQGKYDQHILEDAWTFGGNITYYMPFGASSNTYLSFDYFRTQFAQQMVVDYEHFQNVIHFYALNGKRSFTDNFQVDFSVDPVERFNITATFRYTNAKVELEGRGLVEKPMTSSYKGVLNLQYATNLNKWIFDFTVSVNGPMRVYDFMKGMDKIKEKRGAYYSPVYPMLYAQVTRRFKGWDVYVGAENLTNFRQKQVMSGSTGENGLVNPYSSSFDASCIWGPLMGIKAHVGFRFTLWKK